MSKILAFIILFASFALSPNQTQNAQNHASPPTYRPTGASVRFYFCIPHTKQPIRFNQKCVLEATPTTPPAPRSTATLTPTWPTPTARPTEIPGNAKLAYDHALLASVLQRSKLAITRPKHDDIKWKNQLYQDLAMLARYSSLAEEAFKRIRQGIEFMDGGRIQEGVDLLKELESGH